ncbi:hypothetical protein DIPPA_18780 [Diplonema papillatum]|nr:hypothetical protein DIPPA_18780 [Diplonema papillatum]
MGAKLSQRVDAVRDSVIVEVEEEDSGALLRLSGVDIHGKCFDFEIHSPSSALQAELAAIGPPPPPSDLPRDASWLGEVHASTAKKSVMRWMGRSLTRTFKRILPFRVRNLYRNATRGKDAEAILLIDPLMLVPAAGGGLARVDAPTLVDTRPRDERKTDHPTIDYIESTFPDKCEGELWVIVTAANAATRHSDKSASQEVLHSSLLFDLLRRGHAEIAAPGSTANPTTPAASIQQLQLQQQQQHQQQQGSGGPRWKGFHAGSAQKASAQKAGVPQKAPIELLSTVLTRREAVLHAALSTPVHFKGKDFYEIELSASFRAGDGSAAAQANTAGKNGVPDYGRGSATSIDFVSNVGHSRPSSTASALGAAQAAPALRWTVLRRYSDFVTLRDTLLERKRALDNHHLAFYSEQHLQGTEGLHVGSTESLDDTSGAPGGPLPPGATPSPQLPPKQFGKLSTKALEARALGLEQFLKSVLQYWYPVPEAGAAALPPVACAGLATVLSFLEATHLAITPYPAEGLTMAVKRLAKESIGVNYSHDAIVTDVEKGSPAEQAGLESGLRIRYINGDPVTTDVDTREAFNNTEGTVFVTVEGWWAGRGRKHQKGGLKVPVSSVSSNTLWSSPSIQSLLKDRSAGYAPSGSDMKRVSFKDAGSAAQSFGIERCITIHRPSGKKIGVDYNNLILTRVMPGGVADSAGLTVGMRLLAIGSASLQSDEDCMQLLQDAGPLFTLHVLDPVNCQIPLKLLTKPDDMFLPQGPLLNAKTPYGGAKGAEPDRQQWKPVVAMMSEAQLRKITAPAAPTSKAHSSACSSHSPKDVYRLTEDFILDGLQDDLRHDVNLGLYFGSSLQLLKIDADCKAYHAGGAAFVGKRLVAINGIGVKTRNDVEAFFVQMKEGSRDVAGKLILSFDASSVSFATTASGGSSSRSTLSGKSERDGAQAMHPPKQAVAQLPGHIAARLRNKQPSSSAATRPSDPH